jgi:serine protease Do
MKNDSFRIVARSGSLTALVLMLWASALADRGLATERNTYKVKNAFRDVVRHPLKSTVRVFSENRRVALGTIVDADGYILTKASELKGDARCQLYTGQRLDAEVVAVRDDCDLAVLKVDASGLAPVQWRESGVPPVGSWVAAPGLETIPVSIGIVSVEPRKIQRRLPAMGIIIEEADAGPRIHRVIPDSGAAEAGLKASDVITHLNGKAIKTRDGLIASIQEFRPGDRVKIRVQRGEKDMTIDVLLGERTQLTLGSRDQFQNSLGGRLSDRRADFPLALQHDTVLQPNQCGGPLVDLDGKAVGINIARASRVSSYAIPASTILPILDELKSGRLVSATPAD